MEIRNLLAKGPVALKSGWRTFGRALSRIVV